MESDGLARKGQRSPNHGTDICRLDRFLRLLVATIVRFHVFPWVFASAFGVHFSKEIGVVDHLWIQG